MLPPNTFGPAPTGPRPSAGSHVRRSSIQNIASISNPVTFIGEGEEEGEASMDLDTASESSSHEEEGVDMGGPRRFDGSNGRFSFGNGGVEGDDEDAEGEDDMDMTQVVYGGIARRSSMAASDADFDVEDESQIGVSDDEKTMDFTLAIGGVLPNAAPLSASTLRNSVGYNLPESPNSAGARLRPGQLMEGEVDMSMDETIAIGGIIEADASLSSGESGDDTIANREKTMTFSFNTRQHDDDGMDMTVAGGGIVGFPSMSPTRATYSQSTARSPASNSSRAAHGTPRFAQPTASSTQKSKMPEKRNVFAPSPSPFKSTPHKGGMDAAGDVAKRLSFGSTTSSGGRKRAREDGDEAPSSPAKRGRGSIAGEVFGAPPSAMGTGTPRETISPHKSPRKSISHRTSIPGKSPAKSPMLRRVLGLPVEGQGQGELDEWDSPPTITLAAFLEMAGVQFMEGLPGLTRRRSSVAKGLLSSSTYGNGGKLSRRSRSANLISSDRDFALHEYTTAQIQSVFLNMYTWVSGLLWHSSTRLPADEYRPPTR
jgi:kinetochore protein Spc7/SPC105